MKKNTSAAKRVLCVLSALTAGGAETFLMKLCRALPPEEYQFDFIVSVEGGCYTQEVLDRGGRIYAVPLRTKDPIGVFRGIVRIVRENDYDCVLKLGNTSIASFDLVAAKMGGAKRLAMRSCNAPRNLGIEDRVLNAALRPILNAITNVKIAPSEIAAEFTFGKRRAHRDVHLLHNGVDLGEYKFDEHGRRRVREELFLNDRFVVGHVGRFCKQKNHRYLLEVFSAIREQRPDASLLLVGTGEQMEPVRCRARELGLENAILFAGERFDIPQILSAMDVFVFPSLYEGMPNAVIEAQAVGLPCIVSDSVTEEANITGLVRYLPLAHSTQLWAEAALDAASAEQMDTTGFFIHSGYDIQGVAREFVSLVFSE